MAYESHLECYQIVANQALDAHMLLVEVDPAFFDFQVSISSDMFALTSHPVLLWAVCISLSAFMGEV